MASLCLRNLTSMLRKSFLKFFGNPLHYGFPIPKNQHAALALQRGGRPASGVFHDTPK